VVWNTKRINRLIFSGGGARGVVYGGAYAALEQTGIFEDVVEIAGSSAGAITAALLATGMPSKKFQAILKNNNFSELLGSTSKGSIITKTAEPLYCLIKSSINDSIHDFLNSKNDISDACNAILNKIKEKKPITFLDLHTLHVEYGETFKELTVTAVQQNTGDLKVFNYLNTPNVEIALACKASGAIPVVLEPVEIDNVKYVDGGNADNIPTKYKITDDDIRDDEALVFAFVEGDPSQSGKSLPGKLWSYFFCSQGVWDALYGTHKNIKTNPPQDYKKSLLERLSDFLTNMLYKKEPSAEKDPPLFKPHWWEYLWRNYLVKIFSSLKTDYKMTERKDEGFQRIRRNFSHRTVGLNVGSLLSVDFDRAQQKMQGLCQLVAI
jgi:predicted patatin/cPLA2 family phospholipase